MINHPRAGKRVKQQDLINVARLTSQYYVLKPDLTNCNHVVKFGTSGHRGTAQHHNFNEVHLLAITQAIAEIRKKNGITGPCYVVKDTHALSEPAMFSVLTVLVANKINVIVQKSNGYTPTPVVSNAIIEYNRNIYMYQADGILITPSHNPPEYGGIKYNTSNGGPANSNITKEVENRANQIIRNHLQEVKVLSLDQAWASGYIIEKDLINPYVDGLKNVIDFPSIQKSSLKIGIHPFGGSGIEYWKLIAKKYQLNITIINDTIDQTFRFMHLDKDGLVRMDCSSKYAMSALLSYRHKFDLIFGNDPDNDRHSIVTSKGIMNPNHYLAVAINYLFQHRPQWNNNIAVGKTFVSSTIIDRVVNHIQRKLIEVPVGFKWFVEGLFKGTIGFGGEESSGASFLSFDGSAWSTDKDGIILCLLAAEITAVTGKNPHQHYDAIIQKCGETSYNCLKIPIASQEAYVLDNLLTNLLKIKLLTGDTIIKRTTITDKNDDTVHGVKITTKNGWFVVRPSGTEYIYKIYCESFLNSKHRKKIETEVLTLIQKNLKKY